MSDLKRFSDINWDGEYRAIGRFVVGFERLMASLRFNCGCVFQHAGLQHWRMSEGLLSAHQLTPEALAINFSVGVAALGADDALKQRAEALIGTVKSLAEHRNAILHGEWMIGDDVVIVTDADTPGDAHGIRRKPSKKGTSVTHLPTANEIEVLATQCFEAGKAVERVFADLIIATYQSARPQQSPPSSLP